MENENFMLDLTQLDKILFLDIETVPEVYHYSDLDAETTKLFDSKNARFLTEEKTKADVYNEKAGFTPSLARSSVFLSDLCINPL